jgi:chemotaxis protein CheD
MYSGSGRLRGRDESFHVAETKRRWERLMGESTRYGSYAMESLINEVLKRGGRKSRLEVKLFGAGKIYDGNIDVGARNVEWVLGFLQTEGLTAVKTDLGDVCPRKVYYFTDSGRVLLKKIKRLKHETIVKREQEYATKIQAVGKPVEEDVTLF